MANNDSKAPPEGKFAEAMRKSKEKRAGMRPQSENRAPAQEESPLREEPKPADDTLTKLPDSETEI